MPQLNKEEANQLLKELRVNALQAGQQKRARVPQEPIKSDHDGCKKFFDAVSKLFHVESKCCSLVIKGYTLPDSSMFLLKKMYVAMVGVLTELCQT